MSERLTIISADCHAGANHETYREYLESSWHEDFDAWRNEYRNPFRDLQGDDRTRNWDDDRRLSEMEADGVVAEVVFPNTVPPFFPTAQVVAPAPKNDGEFPKRLAGLHAHNRWLADFVAAQPRRRVGIGQVFLNDVEQAVRDVRWMGEHGIRSVLLPGVAPDTPWIEPLYSPIYEPLWAVCEELEMPITRHSGGSGIPSYGRYPFVNSLFVLENNFFCNRTFWHLAVSGVFDRFPNLRLVLTEQGSRWVPDLLESMDRLWDQLTTGRIGELDVPDGAVTKCKGSEYFRNNVWIGASFPGPAEAAVFKRIGLDKFMWGSDYPHNEGTYPNTRASLREAFAGWAEPELRMVLSENIARVYGFDLDALSALAAEHGPTVEEILLPNAA